MDIKTIVSGAKEIATILGSDTVRESLLGSYSDGTTRSLPDAWNGEFMSPKEKKKVLYGDEKKSSKSKHKKKKKKKNKSGGKQHVKNAGHVKFTL